MLRERAGGVFDRHVKLAALADPWLEIEVHDVPPRPPMRLSPPRIRVQLGWTGPVEPECVCPGAGSRRS